MEGFDIACIKRRFKQASKKTSMWGMESGGVSSIRIDQGALQYMCVLKAYFFHIQFNIQNIHLIKSNLN